MTQPDHIRRNAFRMGRHSKRQAKRLLALASETIRDTGDEVVLYQSQRN